MALARDFVVKIKADTTELRRALLREYSRADLARLAIERGYDRHRETNRNVEIIDVPRYNHSSDQWAIDSLAKAHGLDITDITRIVAVGKSLYFWVLERDENGLRYLVGEGADAHVAYRLERRDR